MPGEAGQTVERPQAMTRGKYLYKRLTHYPVERNGPSGFERFRFPPSGADRNVKLNCGVLNRRLEMVNTQKTAIVTGGSQGIGAGLVNAFLDG